MARIKIEVLSHFLFDEKMKSLNLNDDNVEDTNMAFISIIGTQECLKYYLEEEDTKHYFKDHRNVLNLDFDDIGTDVIYNGHHLRTLRIEEAEKAVDFIENVILSGVEEIKIHCRAGYSRSRAFAEWIFRYCNENGIEVEYEDRNDYTTMLNSSVLRKLNHAYWKKYHLECYEDANADYPKEIKEIEIKTINIDDF